MIIGTAGHIDHGKTSLVKALTGIDADRLPEEKARGMTIDLGFAYIPTASGEVLGFVDVPGHEKFVHTMAAGATGMDHSLLVVAADDGLMPQTREHLRIIDWLGVRGLTLVITKADLAQESRVEEVRAEALAHIARTRFGQVESHVVSTRSGQGVEALKAAVLQHTLGQARRVGAYFRLAIDRVFVVKGMGVAITGAVRSGRVSVGDTLQLASSGSLVRVRSIHAQHRATETAEVGQRCGLVLTGAEFSQVKRADWLLDPALALQTQRVDCLLHSPGDAQRSLKDGERVLLYHGCDHVGARLIMLDTDELKAGQHAYVQCVLERPVPMCWHDQAVLRDAGARLTLAGARVLDINPPRRGRKTPERLATLALLCDESPEQVFDSLLSSSLAPLMVERWAIAMNRPPAQLLQALRAPIAARVLVAGQEVVLGVLAQTMLVERLTSSLQAFHVSDPDEPGVAIERLRRMALPALEPAFFKAWIQQQLEAGTVLLTGSFVHLPDHRVTLSAQERVLWEKLLPILTGQGFDPPWVRDLAKDLQTSEDTLRALLRKQARLSVVVQLVKDLFYPQATMVAMADLVRAMIQEQGAISVVHFRDRAGLGRKRAIQVLEAFDRIGLTRRLVIQARAAQGVEKDHRILRNAELFTRESVR